MRIENIAIDAIKPYKNNGRLHSQNQLQQIANSIKEFGFNNPILLDENNQIIAGHGRLEAAKKLNLDNVPCITLPHLTASQKKAYIIADNKIALNAEWDFDLLKVEFESLQDENFDLAYTGFDKDELNAILNAEILNEGLCDADEVPEIKTDPVTKLGDIWLLGEHRLKCANSTCPEAVDRLMNGAKADMVFTDPPYNTGMTSQSQKGSGGLWKGSNGSTRLSHMFDDSYTPEEWQDFLSSFVSSYWMIMKEDSVAYICLDWRRNHELIPHIENAGFKRSNCIVWDKVVHGLGSDYKYTYEFLNVCKKGKPKLNTHQGEQEYSDIWHIQRKMGKDEDHATKKPVELVERCLRHASNPNDIVVDLFGGSGTTLIACEKLGRKCLMMELSPQYCDIIIQRWQKFTNKKATLESTGETYDEKIS